jgi:hypothetical protein
MKTLAVLFLVVVSSLAFAQATEISGSYDKIGKFVNGVAIVHKGGLVGVINADGKEVIKPFYEKISSFGKDGVAYTHKNGLVGLIDVHGKVIVDNIYDNIGHYNGGKAVVRKNGLCGVIDRKGKVLVDVKYQKLNVEKGGIVKAVNADGSQVLLKTND